MDIKELVLILAAFTTIIAISILNSLTIRYLITDMWTTNMASITIAQNQQLLNGNKVKK